MSETPRTDSETWKPFDTEAGCDMDCEVVDADFARQLERELNQLRHPLVNCSTTQTKGNKDENV